MILLRLQHIAPLLNAASLLTQIADDADIKLTQMMFTIIASHRSSRFVVVLKKPSRFFSTYSINENHSSKISLPSFHSALLDGSSSSSMTIHLLETTNQMILRFENSMYEPQKRHELNLSPPREEELGKIDYGRFLTIDVEDFRNIITKFSIYQDEPISVTLTISQVKFSAAAEEIILTKEEGQCIILGHDEEDETTQFLITLHPIQFFLDLINQTEKVWFFKTIDSRGVIRVTFGMHNYVIYFP